MTELAARLAGTTNAPVPNAPAPNAGTATVAATVAAAGPDTVTRTADAGSAGDEALVAEELLVEEVSIDGMCGVY
jgi:mycofactocin precursor